MAKDTQNPPVEDWDAARKRGWQFRCREPEIYKAFTEKLENGEINSVNAYLNDLVAADLRGVPHKPAEYTRGQKLDLIAEWSKDNVIYSTILAEFLKDPDSIKPFAYAILALDHNNKVLDQFMEVIEQNQSLRK